MNFQFKSSYILVIPFMFESSTERRCQKKWNSTKCLGNVNTSLSLPQGFVCPYFDSPWNLWHWDLSNINNIAFAKQIHHFYFYLWKTKPQTAPPKKNQQQTKKFHVIPQSKIWKDLRDLSGPPPLSRLSTLQVMQQCIGKCTGNNLTNKEPDFSELKTNIYKF